MALQIAERYRFGLVRPDLAPYITEVLGTYCTCMHEAPQRAEEVFRHIFGDDVATTGCIWCQETIKRKIEHRALFLEARPKKVLLTGVAKS